MALTSEAAEAGKTAPGWMEADLEALAHNYRRIGELVAPSTRIIASIKANAYGHGVEAVAETLVGHGCGMLATGSLPEAVALRKRGIAADILMFGRYLPNAYGEFLEHGLIPTIHAPGQAEILSEMAAARRVRAFVKVDAGLGRLGFPVEEVEKAILAMARLRKVELVGLYTHLPFALESERGRVERNIARFADLVDRLASKGLTFEVVQANASAGLLSGMPDPFNAVCPGHALYGLEPSAFPLVGNKGLRPVLTGVRTRLIQVGAGAKPRGVLPFGQTEGLSSRARGTGHVLVAGRRAPLLGVSFEHAVIDVSGIDCTVGDIVTLVGEDGDERIGLDQFAQWQGASVKDALCALSFRIPVHYG